MEGQTPTCPRTLNSNRRWRNRVITATKRRSNAVSINSTTSNTNSTTKMKVIKGKTITITYWGSSLRVWRRSNQERQSATRGPFSLQLCHQVPSADATASAPSESALMRHASGAYRGTAPTVPGGCESSMPTASSCQQSLAS